MNKLDIESIATELLNQARERLVVRAAIWIVDPPLRPKVSVLIDLYTWFEDRFVEAEYRQIEGPWTKELGSPFVTVFGRSEEEARELFPLEVANWTSYTGPHPRAPLRWASSQPIVVARVGVDDGVGVSLSIANVRMVLHLLRFHAQLEGLRSLMEEFPRDDELFKRRYVETFLKRMGGLLNESFARLQETLEF